MQDGPETRLYYYRQVKPLFPFIQKKDTQVKDHTVLLSKKMFLPGECHSNGTSLCIVDKRSTSVQFRHIPYQ